MHWPQVTLLCLMGCSLLIHLAQDGEPRTEKYNFSHCVIGTGINAWLLWMGGFFA